MVRKKDKWGEYDTEAGSTVPLEKGDTHPRTGKEITYHPCGAVLKFTYERYGEVRYCTGMSAANFSDVGHDREFDSLCKHHQVRGKLMENAKERFKTGAFAKSYEHVFQYMPPHKQVMSIELYRSLIDDSMYDFEPEATTHTIDTSDASFVPEDDIDVEFPVPTSRVTRCTALWFAAIDFIVIQNIKEEQFKVAAEEDVAVGEKEFEREAESGEVYTVVDEHHLNIEKSRLTKDYDRHMKFGGVTYDADEGADDIEDRTWTLEIDTPKPEATDNPSPFAEIDLPEDN